MGQKISVLKPDKSVHGATIQKDTLAGRKSQFALLSTTANGQFTIPAGQSLWLSLVAEFWANNLPVSAWNAQNLIQPNNILIFPQLDAYIDTLDVNHYIGAGNSLTFDQSQVTASQFIVRTPPVFSGLSLFTGQILTPFHNSGSSSHIVFYSVSVKYIATGDANL